jgi:uncharacterized protein YqgV (UPF0045/DUF77 family)
VEVVGSRHRAERQVQVGVDVDPAGDHQPAGSVHDLLTLEEVERGADLGDAAIPARAHVDPPVTVHVDDAATSYQHRVTLAAMRLSVEFTIEPFVEGSPGPHVAAGIDAVQATGVDVEVGPFGTTATGEAGAVLAAVTALCEAATAAGAKRISLQLNVLDA